MVVFNAVSLPKSYKTLITSMKNVVFWIQSSRGTEKIQIVQVPDDYSDTAAIKSRLEDWCDGFGAMHVSDNLVSYGWVEDSIKVRKVIQKYEVAKANRSNKVSEIISRKITAKQYLAWLKKNKKALTFPFK